MKKLLGLHHVTAITGNPQANVDFYTRTLGLHLVKILLRRSIRSARHHPHLLRVAGCKTGQGRSAADR
jgi:catechol 2,3-dioxygenase-like lactoylglutathione lyase family enzyme